MGTVNSPIRSCQVSPQVKMKCLLPEIKVADALVYPDSQAPVRATRAKRKNAGGGESERQSHVVPQDLRVI